MKTFDRSRPWIAAGAAGLIRPRALEESRNYSLERKTFGVPIAQHQAIQFMLAGMAIAYEATRLLCHKAAWIGRHSGKLDSDFVSAYAKAYGADAAMRVATHRGGRSSAGTATPRSTGREADGATAPSCCRFYRRGRPQHPAHRDSPENLLSGKA